MSRDVIEMPTIPVDRDGHCCNMDLGRAKAYANVHRIANGPSGPISVALDFLISEVERLAAETCDLAGRLEIERQQSHVARADLASAQREAFRLGAGWADAHDWSDLGALENEEIISESERRYPKVTYGWKNHC